MKDESEEDTETMKRTRVVFTGCVKTRETEERGKKTRSEEVSSLQWCVYSV